MLLAIIEIESAGNPSAQSAMNVLVRTGQLLGRAQGLMQVMPSHFGYEVGEDGELAPWQRERTLDPETNIAHGDRILYNNYMAFGTWPEAARRYFGIGTDVSGASDHTYVKLFQAAWAKHQALV